MYASIKEPILNFSQETSPSFRRPSTLFPNLSVDQADAWFTKRQGETQLEELTPRFHCENVGTSIMTKKGSPLPAWWDTAFEEFYSTGEFNQFCLDKGLEYNCKSFEKLELHNISLTLKQHFSLREKKQNKRRRKGFEYHDVTTYILFILKTDCKTTKLNLELLKIDVLNNLKQN